MVKPHPVTPYPEVNSILEELHTGVAAALRERFLGLYLHGSLATGDFNPATSDVDFLVVTCGELPADRFPVLKAMHARLFASGRAWSQKLEGAYLPLGQLRRHDPAQPPVPWLGADGHFALERLGSDWTIQRWILRERGRVVSGPTLKPMIDPVGADELKEAVRANLRDWWSPPLPSPERFESAEYQVYAVLTMCRSLYLLEHGAIASKPAAARWAEANLEGPWPGLVEAARLWRPVETFQRRKEMDAFIQFTLRQWGITFPVA
ncbi:MAG TPA: aminoglycoside adenylyltransferase domain-containing protein [Anaerolineales bacterium]|nr:aminoglycoside adenylyltransferase domain-containing protein [Anaerolineales bacterium]